MMKLPSEVPEYNVASRWPPELVGLCLDYPGDSQNRTLAVSQVQGCRLYLLVLRPRQPPVASSHCPSSGLWRHQEQVEYFFHLNVLHILRLSFNKYLSAYYVSGTNLDAKDTQFFEKSFSIRTVVISVSLVSAPFCCCFPHSWT